MCTDDSNTACPSGVTYLCRAIFAPFRIRRINSSSRITPITGSQSLRSASSLNSRPKRRRGEFSPMTNLPAGMVPRYTEAASKWEKTKDQFNDAFRDEKRKGEFLLTSQYFLHLSSFGQLIYELVEIPHLLNQWIFNFFDSVSTNHAPD